MTTFDPRAPLAPAPDPWEELPQPSVREGPPFHMTDMIAAEPFLAERLLDRLGDPQGPAGRLAGAIGQAASSGASIVVTGCGTSEHAAMAIVEILREGLRSGGLPSGPATILSAQAFELSLDPPNGGLVIGISHEGGSTATIRALEASAAAGARTALITGSAGSPAAAAASSELVVATVEMDQGWCHTVGYVAPIVAAAAIADELADRTTDGGLIRDLLASGAADEAGAESIAAVLAGCATIITIASGADRAAARELALKIEEAAWIPTTMRDLETFLHGHLPACDERTGLVLIEHDRRRSGPRRELGQMVLQASARVGVRCAVIGRRAPDPGMAAAGYVPTPVADALPAAAEALLATAPAVQWLAHELALARGVNPDLIRREQEAYREAAKFRG
jgi:fructoselysine-6-P-deglycase FrlB-like protein